MKNAQKKFLKLPEYPGGKEAFKKFIKANLKYPKLAIEKRIEGIVFLLAEIDDNGNVVGVEVIHGIGGGCDEEAIRLMKTVQFGGVKNKGLRLKTKKRFKIEFKLPPQNKVNYNLKKEQVGSKKKVTGKSYTYSIKLNNHE